MAKNLNVSLAFTANTNEAIAAIKQLQKELNGLATGSALKDSGISQITPEIQRAMVAAGELQAKLEAATNLKTGKLDLSQFSDSLKKGGVSLQQYANQLNALGPAGRQAFTNLASSIIQAEAPLIRCSQRVKELGTTLANTARWQLSSSILHGFMGAVSSAYGYAQDLNKSLNDIRIVTGASVAEMDAFAVKANKAARALSTTTNEYAKASLIYFQQGDTQSEAMQKAAVTAKMANVTGQSADVVSNQLTAIWNNFNKEGDVAYEHFADVLTKLGAATASSTDEIAGGLEKFAGIADTIGLSYEYAASALATITATSRQSEEVVGTALKTIFARIQGLNLGETLEDGTSLNKYSAALQTVGINIFEASSEMKKMDDILDEMGAKWQSLNKDQQMALAQTVAGTRQYTQLVTLMDNWGYMGENLKTAMSADGELDKQAEIYAESWQAARDEVRAAAEELYTKLLDDDFFIGFLNGIEKVIDGVSGLVDAFGGLKGVLTTIGAYVTKIFQKEMAQGLRTAAQNIKGLINPKGVQAKQDAKKAEAIQALRDMKSFNGGQEGKAENAALSREALMQERLYQAAKNISEEEAKQLQIQMDSVRAMDKRAIAAAKNLDVAEKELKSLQDQNRLRTKMDAQVEARDRGRTKAGKALLEQAHKGVGQNTTSFGESERQVVLAAEARAQQAVRSRHNFTADVSLDGYEDEIALELTRQLKGALADLDLKEGVDKKSVQGQLDKAIREAVVEATSGVDVKETGKNVDTYQVQVQKAGNLNAQGIALSKLGAGGLTTQGADAKGLESIYTQLKVRIDAAQEAASQLKQEVKDSGNASNEIAQLNGVFEGLQTELEAAKGDAEALQKILDKLADESGAGELISRVAQNIGGEGGYIAQEANDGINQPSFDMSGQFESATNVGLKNIQSYNANVDVENSQQDLEDSFDKAGQGARDWADGIANATSTIMALGSAITSVQGAIDVFNDPDATGWDKVSAIISVIVGVLPVATGLFQMFGTTAATSGAAAGAGMTAALGPIGGIILAVTALIAAFVLLADAAHAASPAGQFEAASKAAEQAASAADQVRAEYDALNQSLNALDSGIEAIHEMERGTLEWRAAIADSNAALIELLSTYGMLNPENFTTDADGLMQITDKAKEELLERQQNAVREADNANYMAQVNKNNAASRLKASEEVGAGISVMRTQTTGDGYTYTYDAATENSHLSADIGQAIAAAMQSGVLTDMSDKDSIVAALESVAGLTEAEAQSVADQIASNAELQASMFELGSAINANTEANRLLNNQIVENAFGDKIDGATQGMTDAQQEQIKNMMGADLEALTNELYESTYKDKGWLGGGITDENIQKQYAEAMGWATDTIDNQSGNKAKYYAKDGTEIGVISDEVARRYMAQQAAIEQMGGNVQQYIDNLQNLIQSGNAISEGIGQAMGTFAGGKGGDISNLTAEERQKMGEAIGAYDEAAGTFTFNGEEINNEKAQALGYADAKAYYDALQGALNAYDLKADKLLDSYSESVQNAMNNADFSELGLDAQKKVGDALQNAYTTQGSEVMNNLSSVFENAGKDAGALADILAGVDWTSDNAVYDLNSALAQQGISVSKLGPGWDAYVQSMLNADNSVYKLIDAFDELRGKMASINKITDGLEFNSVISDEDYETLLSYNKEIADMFTMTAEGWKFIGDVDQLNSMLETSVEDVGKFKEEFVAAQNAGDTVMQYMKGWQMEDGSIQIGGDYMDSDQDKALAVNSFLNENAYGKGTFDPIIEASGYSKEALSDAISSVANATEADKTTQAYQDALAIVESFYGTAQGFMDDYTAGKFEEATAEELWVNNQIKSLNDLEQAYKDGEISLETYGKMQDSVFQTEVKNEGFDYKEIDAYADSLQEVYGLEEDVSKEAALYLSKMSRGIDTLSKNWSSWSENLDKSKKGTAEYAKAFGEVQDAVSDLLDIDATQLSSAFFESAENLELIGKAAKGDAEAIDMLRAKAAAEIYLGVGYDLDGLSASEQAVFDSMMNLANEDLVIGATLDNTQFGQSLWDAAVAAEGTVGDIQSMFESLGWEPEITTEQIPMEAAIQQMSGSGFVDVVDPLTGEVTRVTTQEQMAGMSTNGMIEVVSINGEATVYKGGGVNTSKPPSGGGGGGGSKPKKAEPTKKSDIVERYKELEDQLDDVREESDRVKNSLDRLYGAEQEAAIERLLELERQEISLMKQKAEEAKKFMQEDLDELMKVSAEVDVEFKVDGKGNLVNYTEEMTELYEELTALETKAGDEWDEKEQEEISALKEKITKLEEAIAAYEETRELLEDINAELDAFKGKPALPLITSDTLDIYWEINDALDDIDEQIKDLERQAEGLSGEEKLKVLEEINRLEQERVAILQQQAEANQKDIEEKRAALDELARLNGLQFEYDENGNIANYQEQMGILQAQLDEFYAKRAADGLSPAEEEAMNSIIAKMQELADLAGDYRNAVEESEDILNEIEDILSGMVADPFVRSDFVDIFKETNDQLDDIDRKISKLQNEADKLTGEARRKKLNEIVTLERKRVEILEHQALIAKTEMEDRKRAMEEIAARQELMFEYDENQNITNYQEQLDVLIDKYEEAYNEALGDDGLIDATEQAILDSISDDIDHLEEFIQAYCDAVDQLEDIEDEREELANGGYVDMSQLDDIADELHDINQSLDDLQELLDDSNRAADRLYGAARIKQMEKNASLLQQEIDLLQQKKTAQDDIIAKEKQQLDEKTGGYIKYDEYGRITNYDSYINAREDQIREYEAALQEGGLSETEATLLQDEIDLLNEQIAAMEDYEQALEEKEDIQNQIEDAYYEWQDLNAEKLQYKLELQLDVNDRELAKIERAIQRLDGNFYSRAEALALMVGGGMNGDSKLGNYNKQLADLEAHYQEVKRQYEAGEISQAKYVEMTKELQAEIESTADAMAALQDQMDSYYKDTLAQARQELNFHISQLTHLTGILNHFKNTLTALGKSKDYEMMGTVLEGQVQTLENEVKASKNAMQMWQKEADSIYQKYQQALSSGNQENADMYYNAYKEALSAANEAENKFYQQSAAWANALRALMENTLAGLAQDLENALTGGTSFDTITTQMKRASSLQEEYLTTTNKIYETTKLMRTAQQEIDKTTNSVAKQKLSQFITETKQMQNQNKLSKYELSIQQAKYDLLVAEIALEEARFAKSTVRLRRDSEGNFGYIYTADAEAIATAEQEFEDAQNKLYNIGLDGANEYTEKYQQTLAEMYDTLTSLQTKYLQGGFESEAEYNAAVLEAKEYYYEKLNQYSELYSVAINAESGTLTDTLVNNSGIVTDALTKNSRIAADAWSTDFADMTTKTDQWMVAVTDYLSQVQNAFADWEVESQRIANETVGTDLTTLKNKVNDIVTESNNLTAAIGDENSGVIKAIYDEITAVSGLVAEYTNLNGQLTDAIQNAYDLSDALQGDIDQAGQDENPPGQYAPGEEESQKPGTVVPEDTPPMGPIETPEDPPHEHYYVKSKTSPTCTEKGYTTYTCSCGDTYDGDYVDALGHNYTSKVIEEATYERGNLIRYTCQRCGDTYEEYDDNKLPKPKEEGSGEVTKPVEPIKPEPTKPPEPAEPVKPDNSDKVEGVAASIWMDGSDVSGWGTGNTRKNRLKEKGVSKAQDYINKHAENGDIYAAWHNKRSQLKQYYYGKFDTGGYTGAWGPEGKWAMLHEKEIVLNKEDTKNFLASLELLDNILSTIDLHAMNSQWTPYLASPGISNIGKEALEQMVNIEASFPNATDKHEIEEAFKDLVNLASQYANRK